MTKPKKNPYEPLEMGPKSEHVHSSLVEPKDEFSVRLLGGKTCQGVVFTQDQVTKLARWLEMDPKDVHERKGDHPMEAFTKAGNWRNISKYAEHHGLRLIGFLAGRGLLEEGKDPVESLAELLYDYLEQPFHFEDPEEG